MSQVTAPGDPSVVPRRGAGCSPRHRPMDIALDCYGCSEHSVVTRITFLPSSLECLHKLSWIYMFSRGVFF